MLTSAERAQQAELVWAVINIHIGGASAASGPSCTVINMDRKTSRRAGFPYELQPLFRKPRCDKENPGRRGERWATQREPWAPSGLQRFYKKELLCEFKWRQRETRAAKQKQIGGEAFLERAKRATQSRKSSRAARFVFRKNGKQHSRLRRARMLSDDSQNGTKTSSFAIGRRFFGEIKNHVFENGKCCK